MLVLKSYDRETKWMSFLIEDDDLLRNFNTIWDKVKADIRKEFDWDPVCNQKSFDNQNPIVMKLQIFMILLIILV